MREGRGYVPVPYPGRAHTVNEGERLAYHIEVKPDQWQTVRKIRRDGGADPEQNLYGLVVFSCLNYGSVFSIVRDPFFFGPAQMLATPDPHPESEGVFSPSLRFSISISKVRQPSGFPATLPGIVADPVHDRASCQRRRRGSE